MHLFHDSTLNTWRLITEKLPEKPTNITLNSMAWKAYYTAIAAIKQNALTVGNQELANSVFIGKPVPDELYEWIGGYKETQETDGVGDNVWTVAILTLPEEQFKCMTCGASINEGEYETFGVCDECYEANYKKQTASGSVAAPKPDDQQIMEDLAAKGAQSLLRENERLSAEIERLKKELKLYKSASNISDCERCDC